MSLFPELDNLRLDDLVRHWHLPAPEGMQYALVWYGEVAHQIARKGERGVKFLFRDVRSASGPRLAGIISALSSPGVKVRGADSVFISHLDDKDPQVVSAAIDGLRLRGDDGQVDRVVTVMQRRRSPFIKGAALRYLSRFRPDRAYPILLGALQHRHFVLRMNAADELGDLGRPEAIPHIKALLDDPDADVRDAAQSAIDALNISRRTRRP